MKTVSGGVCAAKGFTANGIHCGIRKNKQKKDLSLIVSERRAHAAAVYTTNLVKGAPLTVTKSHLADGFAQAIICNSGNANTCNANGVEIAEAMCALVEKETGIVMSNSPTQTVGYPSVSELPKTTHAIPLLSMDKVKNEEEMLSFIGDKLVLIMLKLDGLTLVLRYENGKLAALKTISYQGDAQGYFTERIYQFTYQENQMWIDRKTLSGYESDESYVITLNSEGYVSQLYKKKESSSEQHTLWMFIYSDGYLQQIQEDYDYYPGDHEDGDEEDGNVAIDPGVSSGRMGRASDRSILQLNWQNGNLMSTEGEFSDESYMSYAYTEYPNVTPYFDFNVVVRPLFGSHTYEYDDMVSMLYMLRMMGKGSKNLVTEDVVDWGYNMPEPGEPEVIHEDTWAPFAYSFTEDNYLDVITGKCTLYSYQEDEHGNHVSESTSYYNDEYRFVYE